MVIGHSVRRLCERGAGYDASFASHTAEWSILDSYPEALVPWSVSDLFHEIGEG